MMRKLPAATLLLAAALTTGLAAKGWSQPVTTAVHPLDPLTRAEITSAWSLLRQTGKVTAGQRLVSMRLQEPLKATVLRWQPGTAVQRQARAVLYDWATNTTSEAVVDLSARRVANWNAIPGAQPPLLNEDHEATELLVRAHPGWQAALRKRGLDPNEVRVMGYPPGGYVQPQDRTGSRLALGMTMFPDPAPFGGIVQGLFVLVDLTRGRVIRLTDTGEPALQLKESPLFEGRVPGPIRPPAKPLRQTQPEGAGFTVDGTEVRWEKWRFRFGMDPRVGLQLYAVGYEDRGRLRPILYRANLSEMVVPYGDAGWTNLNPFDAGENGMLRYGASSLNRLADAPEQARYFSAPVAYGDGSTRELPRAVALYERDGGILWRHNEHSRRARELVLMSFATIDNYDYAFQWIFRQDGTLESEVLLTGQLNVKSVPRFKDEGHGSAPRPMAGHLVAPQLEAPNHQHFFSYRLDLDVDGELPNTVVEVDTEPLPEGPENPDGNGWVMRETPLHKEREAQRDLNLATHRRWKVVNGANRNPWGHPTGYTLVAGENGVPLARPSSFLRRNAAFVEHHLWVTPQAPDEEYAAGDYVNAAAPGEGLPKWTAANRSIESADVVLWYTLGVTHLPRPEDWPVMPVHRAGFKLVPTGFFARNPALDVPAEGPVRVGAARVGKAVKAGGKAYR